MKDIYRKPVVLLIDILTEIAKEDNFALHGGTAINLFHLNMPRLSVDIDLTFVPFSDNRHEDLNKIRQSLEFVKNRLKTTFPNIRFEDEKRAEEELKLLCTKDNAVVKVEVNQINRGLISETCTKILCPRAEEEFDRFCEIKTVSAGQLWGGKLNAAQPVIRVSALDLDIVQPQGIQHKTQRVVIPAILRHILHSRVCGIALAPALDIGRYGSAVAAIEPIYTI